MMSPEQITIYQSIAKRLDEASHGEKGTVMNDAVKTTGESKQTIYRNLAKVGYQSGRQRRSDCGDTHVDLNDARIVCNLMFETARKNDKRLMSCERAIEIAYSNNWIKEQYNASTLLRVAREHGFHPDQLAQATPHTMMRSLHPNHVWQVDASVGTLFYLPAGGVQFFDEKKHYKNKPENLDKVRNHLCVRYAAVDHYSGAFFVKYYATRGENQAIFFDVLANAFLKREGEVMHGVPHMLVMDKGSANTSHLVINFLDKLEINHWAHMAGNPRAKGAAEKVQDIIERNLESRLRLTKTPVKNVDELNDLARRWSIHFNATAIHTRTKQSRDAVWMRIKEDELRIAPSMEVMQSILSSKVVSRKVNGDLTITFRGPGFDEMKTYSVKHIPLIKNGEYVDVSINPYRSPNIDVAITNYKGETTFYECKPIEIDDAGFYADAPIFGEDMASAIDTITDIERKAMHKKAYEATTLEEADKKKANNSQLFGGKIDPMKHIDEFIASHENVEMMPKRGQKMDIEAPHQVLEKITVAEACRSIRATLGDRYPSDTYQQLSKRYPDGIDPMQIDAIAKSLIDQPKLKVIGE